MIPLGYAASERDSRYERWRWQIFAVTWLAYAGFYLTRKSFPVAKIGIQDEPSLQMSKLAMSWIDGAYLTAYAIGQFIFGMLGDKAGTRIVVLAGMIVSVIAGFVMGASTITLLFGVMWCIQGLAQSTGWAPLTKNMSTFFSRRERGMVMGFWCTNYATGGFIASIIAGWAGDQWGWRYAFYVPAGLFGIVALLFLLFQRNKPEDVALPPIERYHDEPAPVLVPGEPPAAEPEGSWKVIGEVLLNPMVLLLSLIYFLLKPARYAILFWGPLYINSRLGTNMTQSGAVSAMFELAGPVGAIIGGFVSDRVFGTRRVPVCVICLFLLGAILFTLNHLPADKFVLGACLFATGILLFTPDSIIAGAAAIDFGTRKGASTASGMINGWGSVGAAVGGTIPGFFSDRWGWGGVFGLLGGMVILAAMVMMPRWNALPPSAERKS
jgi:OPA family sugar phosphate sensor protein UhpC-like MFS transporter